MDATKFAEIVEEHYGTMTAQDDTGLTRVEFKNFPKTSGFYDDMISRRLEARIEDDLTVIVQL